MFHKAWTGKPIRLLGVYAQSLEATEGQTNLLDEEKTEAGARRWQLSTTSAKSTATTHRFARRRHEGGFRARVHENPENLPGQGSERKGLVNSRSFTLINGRKTAAILNLWMLSVVIPIHNEEPSILPLYDRLTTVLEKIRKPYEIIFVDDASTDRSFDLLANLVETDARLKVIRLRRNFGQTAALAAGFDESQGNIVISLDGDLQHAPEDIPALLEKIEEGYDIASGWRKNRLDNAVTRKIPSRIANWLMAKASQRRSARFRHHLQSLPRRDSQGRESLRRAAPLHSRAGVVLRRARRRSAHPQPAAGGGRIALRPGPHLPRDVRYFYDLVPAEVLHAAHALLRKVGTCSAPECGGADPDRARGGEDLDRPRHHSGRTGR